MGEKIDRNRGGWNKGGKEYREEQSEEERNAKGQRDKDTEVSERKEEGKKT